MHKVALIGAGRIGRIHARNAALHPRLTLAAIVDPVEASAASLAGEWSAEIAPHSPASTWSPATTS